MFNKLPPLRWSISTLCFALFALPVVATGQDSEQLLFTVGTTGEDSGGNAFGYIVLQAQRAEAIIGRPYAIYEKAADFPTAAPFRLRAVIQLQTNPQTIRSILNASAGIDEEFDRLEQRVDGYFEDLDIAATGPGGRELDLAEKVSFAVRSAQAKPELFEGLYFLGRLHPGINAVLGLGYFGELDVSLATWEIRQWNPASGEAEQVVGRVLMDQGKIDPELGYAPLPAPGRPVDVAFPASETAYAKDPRGHLNVRLRWPTPPDLREASLLALGYSVYRLPADLAIDLGYADRGDPESRAPSIADTRMLLDGGLMVQTNVFPIMPESDLSEAAAYDANDAETFFVADDDDRFEPDAGDTFSDGDEFYYFVAAQDLLRRSGRLSTGHFVRICDQLPPIPVREVQVRNFFSASLDEATINAFGGDQSLEVRWRQLTEADLDDADDRLEDFKYYIYRWDSPQEMLAKSSNPLTNLVAGPINHNSSEEYGNWIDRPSAGNPDAPTLPDDAGRTYYYTVRVEDSSACGGNLSGNSGPVFGVLRDRRPLGDPIGGVQTRCLDLEFDLKGVELFQRSTEGAASGPNLRVAVRRTSPDIEWARVRVSFGKTAPLEPFELKQSYYRGDAEFVFFEINPTSAFNELRLELSGGDRFGNQTAYVENLGGGDPRSTVGVEITYELNQVVATDQFGVLLNNCGTHYLVDRSVPGGRIVPPLIVGASLDERAREYKIYRRINDGDLTLIKQGQSEDIFESLGVFTHEDIAMPSAPRYTICYFAQVFDEHGNASALTQLGDCIEVVREYPVPLLSAPELYTGPDGESMARVTWYCAPEGIERFEVWMATASERNPGDIGADLPQLGRSFEANIGEATSAFFLYQTNRLGGPFGQKAPEFSVDLELNPNEAYRLYVRAVSEGTPDSRMAGPFSNLQSIAWTEADPTVGPNVPWPDRKLPGLLDDSTQAAFKGPFAMEVVQDPFSGAPLPMLLLGEYTLVDKELDDVIVYDRGQPINAVFNSFLMPRGDPADWVSRRLVGGVSDNLIGGKSVFPFALYRYRIDAPIYREVSKIVEQVTPLIREIAHEADVVYDIGKTGGDTILVNRIQDPFFDFRRVPGHSNGYSGTGPTHRLYLRDNSPLQLGGTYQYLVVFFTERGEIDTVFPLNPVVIQF